MTRRPSSSPGTNPTSMGSDVPDEGDRIQVRPFVAPWAEKTGLDVADTNIGEHQTGAAVSSGKLSFQVAPGVSSVSQLVDPSRICHRFRLTSDVHQWVTEALVGGRPARNRRLCRRREVASSTGKWSGSRRRGRHPWVTIEEANQGVDGRNAVLAGGGQVAA